MSATVTRLELAASVAERCRVSRANAAANLEQLLEIVAASLIAGEDVKLSGFGKFAVRHPARRLGRNVRA
jgi:integration host factor subunit alpha